MGGASSSGLLVWMVELGEGGVLCDTVELVDMALGEGCGTPEMVDWVSTSILTSSLLAAARVPFVSRETISLLVVGDSEIPCTVDSTSVTSSCSSSIAAVVVSTVSTMTEFTSSVIGGPESRIICRILAASTSWGVDDMTAVKTSLSCRGPETMLSEGLGAGVSL